MKPFNIFITEQTTELYHGSFRPRIEKFFPLTHVGDYKCAIDRLYSKKENEPAFKNTTHGYVYKVTADISNSAVVKDHIDIADPGVKSMDKLYRWAGELINDPRVKNSEVIYNGRVFSTVNRLKYIQKTIERGWWMDFGNTPSQAAKEFINYFVYILHSAGINSLVYKNKVECPGSNSYIILNPRDTMKIVGRAKIIPFEQTN